MDVSLLLNQIAKGDEQAFASIVNHYTQPCYRVAWRQVYDQQLAEDITQEVLLTLWRKPESWKVSYGCKFETWLYRVVINRCIDHQRKKMRQGTAVSIHALEESGNELTKHEFEPERLLLDSEESLLLEQALRLLDERSRALINLFYFEKISQKDIAEILDTTPKAVESLISRIRKKLKEICNELRLDATYS